MKIGMFVTPQYEPGADVGAGFNEVLEQARRRLAKGADQEEVLEFVTASLLKKILHRPSVRLREAGEQSEQLFIDAIRELFGLQKDD